MNLKNYDVVVLSPHIDDAFLSMGGTIGKLSKDNDILVIDIFGNTTFTVNHTEPELVKEVRTKEDKLNINKILTNQSTQKLLDLSILDYPDAVERGMELSSISDYPRVDSETIESENYLKQNLVKKIEKIINDTKASTFYIPSCVGEHIDHVIVRESFFDTLKKFDNKKFNIFSYFELPYSLNNKISYMIKEKVDININLKLDLVSTYESQLFDMEKLLDSIKNFSGSEEEGYYEFFLKEKIK
jgi:LmbE family N-acetylglucosaminyl deacetylase